MIAPAYWLPLFSVYRPEARTTWASQGKRPWAARHLSLARSSELGEPAGLAHFAPASLTNSDRFAQARIHPHENVAILGNPHIARCSFRGDPAYRLGRCRDRRCSLTEDRAGSRDAGATLTVVARSNRVNASDDEAGDEISQPVVGEIQCLVGYIVGNRHVG